MYANKFVEDHMELIVIKKFDQPEINNDSKICLIKVLTAGEKKITLNTIILLKQEKKKNHNSTNSICLGQKNKRQTQYAYTWHI